MSPDKEKELYEKYTKMLGGMKESPVESCLAFGIETGDGWFGLIDEALGKINDLNEPIAVCQIKEKFGGLRIYISGGSDKAYDIVDEAERKAAFTCEVCGKYGELNEGPWYVTLCKDCDTGTI